VYYSIVTVPVQLTLKLSRALRPQSRLKGIVLLRWIRLSTGGRTDRDWLSEAYVNRASLSQLSSSLLSLVFLNIRHFTPFVSSTEALNVRSSQV
jgi:hypothetical protein